MNQTNIPPPFKLIRPSQLEMEYKLKVVQEPIRARCCGFGDKDRRPVDPPPILELILEDKDGMKIEIRPEDTILFLVQCELYDESKTENRASVYTPWSLMSNNSSTKSLKPSNGKPEYVNNLMGSTVSSVHHLHDQNKRTGAYFIFHDLSVRIEGVFTLKFSFVNLTAGDPLTMSAYTQDEVFSAPFSVFSAKKFPGLTESTSLSRCFSKQGIKIPIRKDTPPKRILNATYSDDEKKQQPARECNLTETHPKIYTRLSIADLLSSD